MAIPIALLLPLIPGLVDSVIRLVRAIREAPETDGDTRVVLDALEAHLTETVVQVRALEIRDV